MDDGKTSAETLPAVLPSDFLRQVIAALRGGALAPDDAWRLADGIELHLSDPRRVSLGEAFGGPILPRAAYWLPAVARHRQACFLAAYRRRCGVSVAQLASAIREYRRRWEGGDCRLPAPPAAYRGRPEELLFWAYRECLVLGSSLPTSSRQLQRLIAFSRYDIQRYGRVVGSGAPTDRAK